MTTRLPFRPFARRLHAPLRRLRPMLGAFAYVMLGLSPAMADDIDVYTKAVAAGGGGASVILFHIDTSKSMDYDFFVKEANNKQDCNPPATDCDPGALPTSLLDKRFFILGDAMRGQITSLGGNFKVGIVGQDGMAGGTVLAEALPLSSGTTAPAGPAPILGGEFEKFITSGPDDVEQPASGSPLEPGQWELELGQSGGSGGWGEADTMNARWTSSAGSSLPLVGPQDWPGATDLWNQSPMTWDWDWTTSLSGNILFQYRHDSTTSDAQTLYLSSIATDTVLYVLKYVGWNPVSGKNIYENVQTGARPSPGDDTTPPSKTCTTEGTPTTRAWTLDQTEADPLQCEYKCAVRNEDYTSVEYPSATCTDKAKNTIIRKPYVMAGGNTNSYVSLTGLQAGNTYYVMAATKNPGAAGDFTLSMEYPTRGTYIGVRGIWTGSTSQQRVGLRFRDIQIPRDAVINNAYVQFQAINPWGPQNLIDLRVGIDESVAPSLFSVADLFSPTRTYRWGAYQTVPSWEYVDPVVDWLDRYRQRGPNQQLNVTDILQQQITSPDWCGGDVAMAVEGDGLPYDWMRNRLAFSFEVAQDWLSWAGPGFYSPSLYVDWSPGAAVPGTCEQVPEKTYTTATSTEDVTQLASGSIELDNTALKIGAGNKAGLRFTLMDIPPGAEIEYAKLVLYADANGSPSQIKIQGINEPLAKPFGAAVKELDDRDLVTPAVTYTPGSWTAGNTYTIATPQLTALVQSMVNGAGWEYDGALGLVLSASGGTEMKFRAWERTASGVDEVSPGQFGQFAPRLIVKMKAGTAMPGGTTHRRHLVEIMNTHAPSGHTSIAGSYFTMANYVKGRTALPAPAMQTGSCANNVAILVTDVFEQANSYASTTFTADCESITGDRCGYSAGGVEAWPALFSMLDAMYEPDQAGAAGLSADGNYYAMRTYSIGMGPLAQTGGGQLRASANHGGGEFFAAKNAAELIAYFKEIIRTVADSGATIAAPGVAVNALNKFEHLDELYYSLFKPSIQADWEGNLKRYRLKNGQIVDVNNTAAVANTDAGLFAETARSWWSPDIDGATVTVGGAGSKILQPDSRKVFTWIGDYGTSLNAPLYTTTPDDYTGAQPVAPLNDALTTDMLGVPDTITDDTIATALKDQTAAYLRGGTNTVARGVYGAAIHGSPTLVTYGVSGGEGINTVFLGDNNGVLHMVNTGEKSSDDATLNLANAGGNELFAFIPQELLVNGYKLAHEKPTVLGGDYIYGLDGNWVAWKYDPAGDGVDPADGDHVFLYGGMRRGGRNIYALDVTSVHRNSGAVSPSLLWAVEGSKAGTPYEHMGQTWSDPSPRWIRWGGQRKRVVFFAGGYDDVVHDDTQAYTSTPHKGRQVYMVDAETGDLLWWASSDVVTGDTTYTNVPDMKFSITAAPMTMDRNGNGLVDGMYLVDLAGQVFRFDFRESATEGSNFVHGVTTVAKLGATGKAAANTANNASATLDNRRFYDAPAVAFVRSSAGGDVMIGLVSGYRERPISTATTELAIVFRDVGAWNLTPPTSAGPLTLANFAPVGSTVLTTEQMAMPGWYYTLENNGEKGMGSPVFFNFAFLFTTFVPEGAATASACTPDVGYSRLYVMNSLTAGGIVNDEMDNTSDDQRYLDEAMPGIGSTIQLLYMGGRLTLVSGTLAIATEDGEDADADGDPDSDGIEDDASNLLDAAIFGRIRRTRWFQMND